MRNARSPFALLLLIALLLSAPGCGIFDKEAVPPDVVLASEGSAQVIETMGQNQKDTVLAYEADLKEAYDKMQAEKLDQLLATGGYDTPAKVKSLIAFMDANRQRYEAEADARKAKFLSICATNVATGKKLNEATRQYLDFLTDSRKNLKAVLDAIKPPAPNATGPPGSASPTVAPATRPALNGGA